MKIKYIVICLLLGTSLCFSSTEKCNYLAGRSFENTPVGSFGHWYNIFVCEEFEPITKEVAEYVQSIKKTEGKTVREVVTKSGNKLCRGDFGDCGEKAFFDKYVKACDTARDRAIAETVKSGNSTISKDDVLSRESYTKCISLANTFLKIFKQVAEQETGKYHSKIIESSSKQYLVPSRDLMQNLSNTMGTIIKKIGSVARSFEGFIRQVYNTGFTVGNG